MFLSTGTRIYNLHHFAQFEVGPVSEQGIYPVRAYYPDSERYETLYANTNIDHCWEYLHKLEHLLNAKEVDMHSTCACEDTRSYEPPADEVVEEFPVPHRLLQPVSEIVEIIEEPEVDDSVDHTVPDDQH